MIQAYSGKLLEKLPQVVISLSPNSYERRHFRSFNNTCTNHFIISVQTLATTILH